MSLNRLGIITMANASSQPGGQQPPGPGPQQSQQPEQPGVDPAESVTDSGGGGSSGCSKGCLGCGCLVAVVLVILTLIGGFYAWQTPQTLGADGWGEVFEMAEGMEKAARAAEQGGDGDLDMRSVDDAEPDRAAAGFDRFFTTLEETTVTGGDVDRISGTLRDWRDSEEVRDFYELYESLEGMEEEESALRQLMAIRDVVRMIGVANRLGAAYIEEIEQPLGAEFSQLNAIVRVAQIGSDRQNVEVFEQAVADAMVEDHHEHREEYEEARELLRQIIAEDVDPEDLPEEKQRQLAEAYAEHLVLVTAALNPESLETWASLSDDEREEIIELLDDKHMWLARYSAVVFHEQHREDDLLFLRMAGF